MTLKWNEHCSSFSLDLCGFLWHVMHHSLQLKMYDNVKYVSMYEMIPFLGCTCYMFSQSKRMCFYTENFQVMS